MRFLVAGLTETNSSHVIDARWVSEQMTVSLTKDPIPLSSIKDELEHKASLSLGLVGHIRGVPCGVPTPGGLNVCWDSPVRDDVPS
jgi:hypothetical protein